MLNNIQQFNQSVKYFTCRTCQRFIDSRQEELEGSSIKVLERKCFYIKLEFKSIKACRRKQFVVST